MKKPYLKLYRQVAHFKVYIVDGKYVRDCFDEEFTNFGQHCRFRFIPKDEFWIDKEYSYKHEIQYYIDHLLVENRLMAKGMDYNSALKKADHVERRERHKSRLFKKYGCHLSQHIHKKLLADYSYHQIKVWVVNGELVRDKFDVDFTEGGHGMVYPFILKNEIWLDDDLSPRERKFILLHELYERNLMAKKIPNHHYPGRYPHSHHRIYLAAHQAASSLEYFYRHHPENLEKKINAELKEVNK